MSERFIDFQQEWQPSRRDELLAELAHQYHTRCEAYDRTVCSGTIVHGSVVPTSAHEAAMVARNAREVREQLQAQADNAGISRAELRRAISRADY